MIWLLENDTITSNVIVGDRKKLLCLHKTLTDKSKFKLFDAGYCIGEKLKPFQQNAVNCLENIWLGHNGNGAVGNIYAWKHYMNSKLVSTMLVDSALETTDDQMDTTISLLQMLKDDVSQIEIIRNLLTGVDDDTLNFVMQNLWEDFYCFYTQVMDVVDFKQVDEYKMSDLKQLKMLSKSLKIDSSASNILDEVTIAESNAKVLKLARDLRNKV